MNGSHILTVNLISSCRFLFGGDQGRLRYPPPELHSPIVECLLPTQVLQIDPCFYFGDPFKTTLAGPLKIEDDTAFVPKPVDTEIVSVLLPNYSSRTAQYATICAINFLCMHVVIRNFAIYKKFYNQPSTIACRVADKQIYDFLPESSSNKSAYSF